MKIDVFDKNIILVFAGVSIMNAANLFYQLLVAHSLSPADFAAFNSLLAIFMLIAVPLVNLQTVVAKYSSEFNALGQVNKVRSLLSGLLKMATVPVVSSFFIFYFTSFFIMSKLKIQSFSSAYLLTALVCVSWLAPIFTGGLQGLELFKWLARSLIIAGIVKLISTFLFLKFGLAITGALAGLLISILAGMVIPYFLLKKYISFKNTNAEGINFSEVLVYIFPIALSLFCFTVLASFDIVLVRYFFTTEQSGVYSLAQMVGKIFLFLPSAISIVMFPRASGLNAKNMDTSVTLKRSLGYGIMLCILALLVYNLFPALTLMVLTGKVSAESITLGRLFSISMSFFSLVFILINYFLSQKDLRFIKYLALFTCLQLLEVTLFHKNLIQVQVMLCINAVILFCIHLALVGTVPEKAK